MAGYDQPNLTRKRNCFMNGDSSYNVICMETCIFLPKKQAWRL